MMSSLLLLFAFALPAAAPAAGTSVVIWPDGVPPQGITHKEIFGNHAISISHREKDGRAELHETKADVIVIQSGEATLVFGGQVIDPKQTVANEIQGSGIKGGISKAVKTGDVIHIPVGVPHQFFLAPGKQITYLVVKVTDPQNETAK